ncbi:MAG: alpha/beta hydrolase family protein [Phenylobacterium sp.]
MDGSVIDAWITSRPNGRVPVILMLQGSNCDSDRDSFASLTRPWRDRYVLLYIAKPGTSENADCPISYLARNTIGQRLHDVLRIMEKLRRAPWWNRKLYVIGASEGGLIAGLVSASVPETKRTAILAYGGALTMGEWWPQAAYAAVLKETGSSQAALAEQAEVFDAFAKARANPRSIETFGGDTNTLAWWASIIDLRLLPVILNVDSPLLLVHGSEDPFAPVEGARAVERAFKKAGKTNLTYREYPDLDHAFVDRAGHSFGEEVTMSSLDWLLGRRR